MTPYVRKTIVIFVIAVAAALVLTLTLTLAFAAAPAGARECCAYKGKHSQCVPCRPTRQIGTTI
jgi:hypothetical protein